MVRPSPEETTASGLMSRGLGVPVECTDTDTSPDGRWDFEFTLNDGTTGAAEMTTITDAADREWRSLKSKQPTIDGSNYQWLVRRRGKPVRFGELLRHLGVVAPLVEQRDVDFELAIRDPSLDGNESVAWFRHHRLTVIKLGASPVNRGRVWPESDTVGAWGEPRLDAAIEWLEIELAKDGYAAKFDKLARSGATGQHLVLRLDIAGVPGPHLFAIDDPAASLPTRPPVIRGRRTTGLWLLPEFARSVVWWMARSGWHRMDLRP